MHERTRRRGGTALRSFGKREVEFAGSDGRDAEDEDGDGQTGEGQNEASHVSIIGVAARAAPAKRVNTIAMSASDEAIQSSLLGESGWIASLRAQ